MPSDLPDVHASAVDAFLRSLNLSELRRAYKVSFDVKPEAFQTEVYWMLGNSHG